MKTENRFYSLDVLKFMLSIVIVFHHYQQITGLRFGRCDFYGGSISFGNVVEFFFIISGFLCVYNFGRKKNQTLFQYIKNVLRNIYPSVFLSVLIYAFLLIVYYSLFGEWHFDVRVDLFTTFSSFLLMFSGGPVNLLGINNPLWYICVLLQCHILFYLVNKISEKNHFDYLYLCVLLSLLGVGIHMYEIDLPFLNFASSRGYAAFFYGVILYRFYQNVNTKKLSMVSMALLIVCFAFLIIDYTSFYRNEWGGMLFVVFPLIMFVMLGMNAIFTSDIAKNLGLISTQIYIWHSPLLLTLCMMDRISNGSILINNGLYTMLLFATFTVLFAFIIQFVLIRRINQAFYSFVLWVQR